MQFAVLTLCRISINCHISVPAIYKEQITFILVTRLGTINVQQNKDWYVKEL